MPVYQYACTECGKDLEVRQSFTDDALTECPACSGRLRKVLSAVGVVFKGSGFYRNDSRAPVSEGSSSTAGKESSESSSAGDKGTTGSGDGSSKDAKPAPAAKSNGSDSKSPSSNGSAPSKVAKAAS